MAVVLDFTDKRVDEQIVNSLLSRRLRLSAAAIQKAKDLAWQRIPMEQRRAFLALAERDEKEPA